MRITLEPAYILHARPFRETSLLLEALSRSRGRVGLVARGARAGRSRWRNVLQPFRPLLLGWQQRGELGTLTDAEQVAHLPLPRGEALFCGLYANELLLRAVQRADPHEVLFDAYRELLAGLAAGAFAADCLRRFERDLLEAAGFGLQLRAEAGAGAPLLADAKYRYVPGTGPVRVAAIRAGAAAGGGEPVVSGAALLALQSGRIESGQRAELKALMRHLLRYHFGERPLVAQSLFR